MSDTFYQIVGCIGFAAMIGIIIAASRFVARFHNRATARALLPLAAMVGGAVDDHDPTMNPAIVATYEGQKLRAYHSPKTNAGEGEGALTINAFYVDVLDLAGVHAWTARFHVTGLFGQGRREIHIETTDTALGERLIAAGLIDALQGYCTPSASYAAAAYDKYRRVLTVTDDVMPKTLPSAENFVRHAQLAVRVAQMNALANDSVKEP